MTVRILTISDKGKHGAGGQILSLPAHAARVFLALLLLLLAGGRTPALAFTFNGQWDYGLSGGDNVDTTDTFHHLYKVTQGFGFDLTDAISAEAAISYTWNETQGLGNSDILTPSAGMQVANDIFIVGFNARTTRTRHRQGGVTNSPSWRTSLSPGSLFRGQYIPTVRLYYGESRHERTFPGRTDTSTWSSDYGADLTLKLSGVNFSYGYNNRKDRNETSQNEEETDAHFGRIGGERTFWDKRFKIRLIQTADRTKETFSGVVPPSGLIENEFDLQLYTPLEPSSDDPDCTAQHTLGLEPVNSSDLSNLETTTTITIPPSQSWHIGWEIPPETEPQVNQLRVYVDDPAGELETNPDILQWDLYGSNFDNTTWDLLPDACNVTPLYNSAEQRFEIDIPALDQPYQYLKIVAANRLIPGVEVVTLNVRGVKGVSIRQGEPGRSFSFSSDATSYKTNLFMAMKLSPTLKASTQLNLFYSGDYSNEVVHADLRWMPWTFLNPSLNFYQSRTNNTNTEENIKRNYNISVPISILPTLNVSLGATRTEQLTGGWLESYRNTYQLTSQATLYPDLIATLSTNYYNGSRHRFDETVINDESTSTSLGLAARLTPKLNCDLTNYYTRTYAPHDTTLQYSNLVLDYRPSDYISLYLSADKNWVGDTADSLRSALRLALLRTQKTRVTFTYDYVRSGESRAQNSFILQGSWDISRIFTLRSNLSYIMAENDTWGSFTSLYMRF